MATQPTLPTFNPGTKRVYRIDANLPAVVTELAYADHLDACKASMELIAKTHDELNRVQAKADFLERRIADPALENHPARDAAWDRLKGYRHQIEVDTRIIRQSVADVDSHGRELASPDLRWLGNHTSWEVIERIHDVEPESKRMDVIKAIAAETAPF